MDSIVSFEVARLLKEKGFIYQKNTYCSWYNERGIRNGRTDINKDGKTFSEVYPDEDSFYGSAIKPEHKKEFHIERFDAPTIAESLMWIYEKKGIWIEARINISNNTFTSFVNGFELDTFNTPYEAYIDAIIYVLN